MLGCMPLDEDHIAVYLFDVAGHGVKSALMSFAIQQSIDSSSNSHVKHQQDSDPFYRLREPSEVLARLNQSYINQGDNNLYFTMIYAVLNTKTGQLNYAFAGHPPMIWQQTSQQICRFIQQESFVAGMFDFASYQTEQIQLSVGDRIFLYSDGITEAESTDKEQYSEQRLALQIQQLSKLTISKQSNTIVEELNNWSGTTQFDDDISLLAFEWNGS